MALNDTQDWISAYEELCTKIKTIADIKFVDLWHEQIQFEDEEYPYGLHAVFLEFNTVGVESVGDGAQDLIMDIRVIQVSDTYADTFKDAEDQQISLAIMRKSRELHALLQNLAGNNFSSLNRIGISRVQAPHYLISYAQTYRCTIRDYGATKEYEQADVTSIGITPGTSPTTIPEVNLFGSIDLG